MAGCSCGKGATSATATADAQSDSVAVSVSAQFSADSAYRNVAAQLDFGPRNPGSEGHSRCRQYLVAELQRYGADTVAVQQTEVKIHTGATVPCYNITASFNPQAKKRILLAAHYDTRPWADEDADAANHSRPIPGANDGASGVAVALELARLIGQQKPGVGVDILLTDVEDSGLTGSQEQEASEEAAETQEEGEDTWCLGTQYWARNNGYTAATRPSFGILLDMVGGRDALFYREYLSERIAPVVNAKIWQAAARLGIGRFVDEIRGAVTDDHLYIASAGIPCADIIECANPYTGNFPAYWHTMADNLDNIDRSTLADVGRTVAYVIYNEPAN